MNLDEDMGGGGFKFKKRERKNRIKTPSEKPEDDDQKEHKGEAAISITDIISQAHQTPSKAALEHDTMGGSADDGGRGEVKEANKEGTGEEGTGEEGTADGEAGPNINDTIDAEEPPATLDIPAGVAKAGPTPRKAPKFKQRKSKEFKSKPPKKGVLGFGDEIPGMDGLGTDITVICPWEAFSHLELHELSQFGII